MIRDTSREAYASVAPHIGQKQAVVLGVIRSGNGMTNAEIAQALHLPINCVTPRCLELRKMGLVIEMGKRSCRVTGRTAYVWGAHYKETLF